MSIQALRTELLHLSHLKDRFHVIVGSVEALIIWYHQGITFASDPMAYIQAELDRIQGQLQDAALVGYNCKRKGEDIGLSELYRDPSFRSIVISREGYYCKENKPDVWYWDNIGADLYQGVLLAEYEQFLKEQATNKSNAITENKVEVKASFDNPARTKTKLVWKGTPAQFGFVMAELIGKGYLEQPAGSHNQTAEILLQIFDVASPSTGKATTKGTLAKEINPNSNSLSVENSRKFTIPAIDKLK